MFFRIQILKKNLYLKIFDPYKLLVNQNLKYIYDDFLKFSMI